MSSPQTINGWQVEGTIGHGDFATVYRVHAEGRTAALKLCVATNEANLLRLQFEESALQRLDHPSIPQFIESGSYGTASYIVMSLMPGQPVKEMIEKNVTSGRLYGDIEVLKLTKMLFEALAHVHEAGLVHRDVKDANVLHSESQSSISLIDFGFCKETGVSEVRLNDSFWRVGAARFSPPAKLDDPALASPSHDVFAAGVMAYRMLTGAFPWSAGEREGRSALLEAQRSHPLEPITEINSYVLPLVASFVASLLELDDEKRPTTREAIEEIDDLLARTSYNSALNRGATKIVYPVVVRDPVHGDIRLTEYEYKILLSNELQRLRPIKQLGLTNLVYPGAEHSRLNHSVGTLARAEQILKTIEDQEGIRIDPELRISARLYALIHDVGHIPFGHTLEDELSLFKRHDQNQARGERLLNGKDSELGPKLAETENGREIIPYLIGTVPAGSPALFVDLVSSTAGADVLDYIDRDAYFCGLDHRIDSGIFRQFRLHTLRRADERRLVSLVGGKYGLRVDRELAVETVLRERYAMFLKVYTHSSKAAASALLGKTLYEALHPSTGPKRALIKEEEIEWMGDEVLIDRLANSSRYDVQWGARQLKMRRLPRGVYRGLMLPTNLNTTAYTYKQEWLQKEGVIDPASRREIEADLARQIGVSPRQVMVYCPPKAPGYQAVDHWVTQKRGSTPTRQEGGIGFEVPQRHLALWEFWVFLADVSDKGKRARLAEISQSRFGMPNVIDMDQLYGRPFRTTHP